MIRRRETFSLLFAGLLAGCGATGDAKPELPESVSPGWKRTSFAAAPHTDGPYCWTADYAGKGTANLRVCRYTAETGAFDAMQRTPAAAQAVKFQEGKYFVLLKYEGAPKTELTALIRAIQKSLNPK